jgi:hypothetical protein
LQSIMLVIALALGIVASLGGGALSGIGIGGAALGKQLAAIMGALYGVMAGAVGVIVGLAVLQLV